MILNVNDTIAICIDYQERLMSVINEGERVAERASILVKGLRALNIPIVVTEQYKKGLGETVEPIKTAIEGISPMEKTTFSAYGDEAIKKEIDGYRRKNAVVFGCETHICVLQTALALKESGYNVLIVDDCCSSRHSFDNESGLKRALAEGIKTSCLETVLFELTKGSGTEVFKTISKLVK